MFSNIGFLTTLLYDIVDVAKGCTTDNALMILDVISQSMSYLDDMVISQLSALSHTYYGAS